MIAVALLLAGLTAAVVLSGFFSGSETGVYCLDRVRLRVASERGEPDAKRLAGLMRRPEDLVITVLLGTNVADYLATAFTSALLLRAAVAEHLVEIYATLIVTPLILVFGGMVPKDWFRRESDRLMYALALPASISLRAARATGLVWLLRRLAVGLARWLDPRQAAAQESLLPRARTLALLREGAARGGLTVWQRDLIDRVVKISTTPVGSVMIRRERVATVPIDIEREDFLRIARMAHFSRLPVYEDDPRRIVGIVNVYDVLTDPAGGEIRNHVREAFPLAAAVSVSRALVRLQRSRQVMAIVQDERDNCVGILTIKDLVQEIIGDIDAW